jgi:hypothetical protein
VPARGGRCTAPVEATQSAGPDSTSGELDRILDQRPLRQGPNVGDASSEQLSEGHPVRAFPWGVTRAQQHPRAGGHDDADRSRSPAQSTRSEATIGIPRADPLSGAPLSTQARRAPKGTRRRSVSGVPAVFDTDRRETRTRIAVFGHSRRRLIGHSVLGPFRAYDCRTVPPECRSAPQGVLPHSEALQHSGVGVDRQRSPGTCLALGALAPPDLGLRAPSRRSALARPAVTTASARRVIARPKRSGLHR